jgi:hypothetical protein
MFTSFSSIRELEFGMKTNLMDFTKKKRIRWGREKKIRWRLFDITKIKCLENSCTRKIA